MSGFGAGRNRGGRFGSGGRGYNNNNRSSNNNNSNFGNSGNSTYQHGGKLLEAKCKPCRSFTQCHLPTNAGCQNANCGFGHIARCHKYIECYASNSNNSNSRSHKFSQNSNETLVRSITVATDNGLFVVVVGGSDGKFRVFNGAEGCTPIEASGVRPPMVVDEKKSNVVVKYSKNYVFVAYEGRAPGEEDMAKKNNSNNRNGGSGAPERPLTVGYIAAYAFSDVQNPQPVTFFIDPQFVPFASERPITRLEAIETDADPIPILVSGSSIGLCRVWRFDQTEGRFVCAQVLQGHVMEVSGITFTNNILWTTSLDKTLRVWDYASGKCQHVINGQTDNAHTDRITNMTPFTYEGTGYLATSSTDKTVKIWDLTGTHLTTSDCGAAVISIGLVTDSVGGTNKSVLLAGLQNGRVLVRSLPSLTLIATFDPQLCLGHQGAVMTIVPGPANTFFTGGSDGIVYAWSLEPAIWGMCD